MKRFKIDYTINGEQFELYAEPLDEHHRMYSLERQLMDPHPLIIENFPEGWKVTTQDDWGLDSKAVDDLGNFLEKEYPNQPQQ